MPPSTATLARVEDLVALAASSSGTEGAVFVFKDGDGTYDVLVRHGEAGRLFHAEPALLDQFLARDAYFLRDASSGVLQDILQAVPALQFVASSAVKRGEDRIGLLFVCDCEKRLLTAAQKYVVRTFAAEIADQIMLQDLLQLHALRNFDEARTERLRLLESVVVNANDAVLITRAEPIDLPGPEILYVNAAFTRTTGYTSEDVIGKTPRLLQGPITDRVALDRLRSALKKWESVEVELLNYRKDGSSFWVELSIAPVCNEAGWYTHWVSVQRDVSERKANEENVTRIRLSEGRNEALAMEVKERMRSEAELEYAAFHDHLTGLRNRAYFMDRLRVSVPSSLTRPSDLCAILFLDVDAFKGVNDKFGHTVGDLMLMEVAERLKGCVRPRDTLARMGGDEFTVLLDDLTGTLDAVAVAQRILEVLSIPIRLGDAEVTARASIGISCGSSDHVEDLLRDADTAMYRAKERGGAGFAIFDQVMHESAIDALNLRSELRSAVALNQFELYYQPVVEMRSGSICGVEALLRWNHPTRGMVPPLEFIPMAEETGLIVTLGCWVLQEACRHHVLWKRMLPAGAGLTINVNVSPKQLEETGFLSQLEGIVQEAGIHPPELQLEITESVFLKNPQAIGGLFQAIRALGVQIACDDFGTGYSSLSFLQLYPIDTLKIDQSFVKRLGDGPTGTDIVTLIVNLAKTLHMEVTAEGIESVEQRDVLEGLGCNVAQGYLFSRAVPFDELTRLLLNGLPLSDR